MTEALRLQPEPHPNARVELIEPAQNLIQVTLAGLEKISPSLVWTKGQTNPIVRHREAVIMHKGVMLSITNVQREIFNGREYVIDPANSSLRYEEIVTVRTVPTRPGVSCELPGSAAGMHLEASAALPESIERTDFDRMQESVGKWNIVSRERFTTAAQLLGLGADKKPDLYVVKEPVVAKTDVMQVDVAHRKGPLQFTVYRA